MNSNQRLTLPFRLEDLVALTFFFICLVVQIIFREVRGLAVSPADVLIIIPAMALLLAKELVHYFVVGKQADGDPVDDLRGFIRPYWEIVRDWFPFLIILLMYYSLWGDATHLLVTKDRDAALIALDQRLFGFQVTLAF